MLNSRPLQVLAVAAGLALLVNVADAQRPTYRNASNQVVDPCCPCPPTGAVGGGVVEGGVVEGAPAPDGGVVSPAPAGEDLPQVADLGGGGDFASAPQSAVPNSIGDTMGGCFSGLSGMGSTVPLCPSNRRFRISENNSALPQCRLYFNYRYFDNALFVDDGTGNTNRLDVNRYELGFEKAIWCGMASVGLEVPVQHTINTSLPGDLTNTEFGNVSVYLKHVLYQDCCTTLTTGVGVDLPTADDVNLGGARALDNDVVIISPFVAMLANDPCNCSFLHAFAQIDLPSDNYDVAGGAATIDGGTYAHVDISYGRWLHQDCCGNGLAAIVELHYTTNIEGERVAVGGGNTLTSPDNDFYNATVGATIVRGCWDVTPAVVLPLLDRPDRGFDYEFAVNVNRRF